MKYFVIFCLLLSAQILKAQNTSMDPGSWEENKRTSHKKAAAYNEFEQTEMGVSNNVITFSDMPILEKPIFAEILDADGGVIFQRKIKNSEDSIKVNQFASGNYTLELVYRQKDRKTFQFKVD